MSTIGSAPPPPAGSTGGSTATAAVVHAAGGLAALDIGSLIKGVVSGKNGQGQLIVSTSQGNLLVTTPLSLPPGTPLVLQVQSAGANFLTVILSIDNQPTAKYLAHNAPSAQAGAKAPPGGTAPSHGPAVTTVNSVLSGAVTGVATSGSLGGTLGTLPNLLTGSGPPSSAPVQGQAVPGQAVPSGQGGAGFTNSPIAGEGGRAAVNNVGGLTANGVRLDFRLVNVENRPSQLSPGVLLQNVARVLPAETALVAGVVSSAGGGVLPAGGGALTHILTPFGTVTLDKAVPLPAGARVVLQITGTAPPNYSLESWPVLPVLEGAARGQWPGLQQAIAAMSADSDGVRLLNGILPSPGPKLANLILLFINALRGGDMRGWLGQEGQNILLKLTGRDFFDRVREDFTQFGRAAADARQDDWRFFLLPLHDGGEHHLIRFHTQHRERQSGRDTPKSKETRFIIDLTLTRLGEVQFDGLIRARQFDMIIRTLHPLSQDMRRDIRRIYVNAQKVTGLHGELSFQAGQSFVRPQLREKAANTPATFSGIQV